MCASIVKVEGVDCLSLLEAKRRVEAGARGTCHQCDIYIALDMIQGPCVTTVTRSDVPCGREGLCDWKQEQHMGGKRRLRDHLIMGHVRRAVEDGCMTVYILL